MSEIIETSLKTGAFFTKYVSASVKYITDYLHYKRITQNNLVIISKCTKFITVILFTFWQELYLPTTMVLSFSYAKTFLT